MDIRKKTCLVVKKGRLYLVGYNEWMGELHWSQNIYDAWRTRDRMAARMVQQQVDGTLCLFNPPAGQVIELIEGEANVQEEEEAERK